MARLAAQKQQEEEEEVRQAREAEEARLTAEVTKLAAKKKTTRPIKKKCLH